MTGWYRFVGGLLTLTAWAAGPAPPPGAGAETALNWLAFGNERFASGRPVHWHQSPTRRMEVSARPAPRAVVLSCSDARVPPEIVFDQGLGDLHVIRVEGNIAGEKELGSIEYAVEQLGASLIVVMGHTGCGIVEAAVRGTPVRGHMASLLASLSAAVSRSRGLPGDASDNAARANVNHQAQEIRQSEPVIAPLVALGKVKVVAAFYHSGSGTVEWQVEPAMNSSRVPAAPSARRLVRSGM